MKKQIPNWGFALLVIIGTVGALWAIGRAAPPTPPQSSLAGATMDASSQEQNRGDKTTEPGSGSATTAQGSTNSQPKLDAPLFKGETIDGKTFDLADYKGKVVLINFWATWCGPCRMEIPDLIRLQEKYGPKGFTVVGLSEDDSAEPVKPFVKDNKINYPVLVSPPGLGQEYAVTGLPTSFLVDKNGKVVWAMSGVSPNQSTESIIAPEIEKAL